MSSRKDCFTEFKKPIAEYSLPERFTFPFYYEPHPLTLLAAEELQHHLKTQTDWTYDFWKSEKENLIVGKMFGVLVVQNKDNQIGYLSAFSGKLGDSNLLPKFVPPVFDRLTENSFFFKGMTEIEEMTAQLDLLEKAPDFLVCKRTLEEAKELATLQLNKQKAKIKKAKKARKFRREKEKELLSEKAYQMLLDELGKESVQGAYQLKDLSKHWKNRLAEHQQKVDAFQLQIDILKKERKERSTKLQKRLFDQYQFLNQTGEVKTLSDIFQQDIPTSGAGECAAPKLLQYAFQYQMKPIAMAEFWWGQSPKTVVRKHKHFYPACIGKCKPILTHMLDGILMDENPMLQNPAEGKEIEIVYEDEHLLVVNKPAEFLSVPGRNIKDSVANRMKEKYPEATGPLVVHRLDMSTSGLMIIAKTQEIHKYLQYQFIKRLIKKRYVALLEGVVEGDEGIIDLPLFPDWDNRPRQLVSYENGKAARTKWKVISHNNQQTRIYFFPVTGRTHQLRVHAAHSLGLNMPIVGDDLYGTKKDRLYLHAEWIEFQHPITKEKMTVEAKTEF